MEKISIIIPCLNEADYIGFLLFSLSRQTYHSFEVIICDGKSEDQTKSVIKSFQKYLPSLRIITSQKRSPAAQRNAGAEMAQYNRLLFLDADVILPPDFLEKTLREIDENHYELAHPTTLPISEKILNRYYYILTNFGLEMVQSFYPAAGGWAIFSTKDWHLKLKGFDERLKIIAEDVDYISRAVKKGASFGIVKSCSPYVSVRRLDREGITGSLKNMLLQAILFSLFGKRKAQKYLSREYGNFGSFQKLIEKERKSNKFLKQLTQKQLNKSLSGIKKYLQSF